MDQHDQEEEEVEVEGSVWAGTALTPEMETGRERDTITVIETATDTPAVDTAVSPHQHPPGDLQPPPATAPPRPPPTPGFSRPPGGLPTTTVTRNRKRKEIMSVIETVDESRGGKLRQQLREKFDNIYIFLLRKISTNIKILKFKI